MIDNELDIIIDSIEATLKKYKSEESEAYERIKALQERRQNECNDAL